MRQTQNRHSPSISCLPAPLKPQATEASRKRLVPGDVCFNVLPVEEEFPFACSDPLELAIVVTGAPIPDGDPILLHEILQAQEAFTFAVVMFAVSRVRQL